MHRSSVFGLTFTAFLAFTAPLAAQSDQDYSAPGHPLDQPLNFAIDYGNLSDDAGVAAGNGSSERKSSAGPDESGVDLSREIIGTWEFSPVIFGRRQDGTQEKSTFSHPFGLELRRTF